VSLLIFSSFLYYFPNCDDSFLKKEENKFLIEKQKEIQNQETFPINYKENQQNITTSLSIQPITSVVLFKGK